MSGHIEQLKGLRYEINFIPKIKGMIQNKKTLILNNQQGVP